MADVVQSLLPRVVQNEVDHGRQVVETDIFIREVEELELIYWVVGIQVRMASGVFSASRVSHPGVVSRVGQIVAFDEIYIKFIVNYLHIY